MALCTSKAPSVSMAVSDESLTSEEQADVVAWGCGYRNAEMAIASLLLLPDSPYASLFAKKGDPGVRAIQDWIDEAWRAGYDPQGRAQLKGQIVGTSKWVGPTGR